MCSFLVSVKRNQSPTFDPINRVYMLSKPPHVPLQSFNPKFSCAVCKLGKIGPLGGLLWRRAWRIWDAKEIIPPIVWLTAHQPIYFVQMKSCTCAIWHRIQPLLSDLAWLLHMCSRRVRPERGKGTRYCSQCGCPGFQTRLEGPLGWIGMWHNFMAQICLEWIWHNICCGQTCGMNLCHLWLQSLVDRHGCPSGEAWRTLVMYCI